MSQAPGSDARTIGFTLNGEAFVPEVAPHTRLLEVLRNDAGLNGPKYGCGYGQCGACGILVDDLAARACMLSVAAVAGRRVTTLEGLGSRDKPGLVQRAFIEGQGAQCGYCLNGMVVTAQALLRHNPAPDRAAIAQALRHNLCRCGTHVEIVNSVELAVQALARGETL
ncbi:(2Fe-2S)-binding protein [Sphingobium sp. Sx8-8]|uniref:(2Fe-2S)-binding protein n=1 Tax=Sphingobium sp. Sx8-8 TaxID=2933617 RepID=UPI001F5A86ED|nr:(2Fe-2S)-binding protein [Sphingobium sp. Sx8-8]